MFVVVNGPPGSGKTTLAHELAPLLGLPLISKDVIKEALMGVWGAQDVEVSRRLGRAAIAAVFSVAGNTSSGAVLEANFRRSVARVELARLPGSIIEVFCTCPRDLCLARYRQRSEGRAAGHFDSERSDEEIWNEETANPVAGEWPVIEIDTAQPVDVQALLITLHSLGPAIPLHTPSRERAARASVGVPLERVSEHLDWKGCNHGGSVDDLDLSDGVAGKTKGERRPR